MKNKHFYTGIADTTTIKINLSSLDLTKEEKYHLEQIIDARLHSAILDLILTELDPSQKEIFLDHMIDGDDNKIWQHLSQNIIDVENKIKNAAEILTKELQSDLESIE